MYPVSAPQLVLIYIMPPAHKDQAFSPAQGRLFSVIFKYSQITWLMGRRLSDLH